MAQGTTEHENPFESNIERERRHEGLAFACRKCKRDGIVGQDLVSAFTVTTRGMPRFSWVHQACAGISG